MSDQTIVPLEVDRAKIAVNPDEEKLTTVQKNLIAQISKDFRPEVDPMAITQFGLTATNAIAALADPVLKMVRGSSAPAAAALLDNFAKDARSLDFKALQSQERGIQLPGALKRFTDAFTRFKRQIETLDKKMKNAEAKLVTDKNLLTSRCNTLFGLGQQSFDKYQQLRCYVYAADVKLAELRSKKAAAEQAMQEAADKMVAQQEVTRLTGLIARLEARKLALKQMQQICVQQVYSIGAVLTNSVGLLDSISVSIDAINTVWKTQVVVALAAYEQQQIAQAQLNAAANLGALISSTADQIGMAIDTTAQVQATGIVKIEDLEAANQKMVANIAAYFEAQRKVEQTAQESGRAIDKMKNDLVAAVKQATGDDEGVS